MKALRNIYQSHTLKSSFFVSIDFNKTGSVVALPSLMDRGGSRTAVTSKMERFVIIVNGWKLFGYYHKVLYLGCCSSSRSVSDGILLAMTTSIVVEISHWELTTCSNLSNISDTVSHTVLDREVLTTKKHLQLHGITYITLRI